MKQILEKRWPVLLKALVSLTLIGILVAKVDIADVGQVFSRAKWLILCSAFSMFFFAYAVTAARWQTLLRALEHRVGYWYLVRSFLVGMFFSSFLPSTVGGDAVRMYDTWRSGATRTQAVAAVLMDRFLGSTVLLLFATAGLYAGREYLVQDSNLIRIIEAGTLIAVVLIVTIISVPTLLDRFATKLVGRMPGLLAKVAHKILGVLRVFRTRRGAVFVAFLYSIVLQTTVILYHWVVGYGLGLDVRLSSYFLIVPVAIVVMMIPISINAIGVRESIFVMLLATQGVSHAEGLAYAWVLYMNLVLQALLGGVVFAFRREGFSTFKRQAVEQKLGQSSQ